MTEDSTRNLVAVDTVSSNAAHTTEFQRSVAIVIGINDYGNGIPRLNTAMNDARRLAEILRTDHHYVVELLVEEVTRARLVELFTQTLPQQVGKDDRLLVYFAGHGIALDGDDGPAGYLIPQDAKREESATFLAMTDLHGWLSALPCRHLLAIMDCCFAGAFRWAGTRDVQPLPTTIYRERYDRFIRDPAWQVLTSAAYDQKALDFLKGDSLGARGAQGEHSPFAAALYKALAGAGDLVPKGGGDGVITAAELYLYLRDEVEVSAQVQANHRQTPGLWPLKKHDKGEFIFLAPGKAINLPPAPELTRANNPYRGLESYNYNAKDARLFFGRANLINELAVMVERQPLTLVLGASGTGKSSLVKAGLLPKLRPPATIATSNESPWQILSPIRPTEQPLSVLNNLLNKELRADSSLLDTDDPGSGDEKIPLDLQTIVLSVLQIVERWFEAHPNQPLLLVIDQLEELITLCRDDRERLLFLDLFAQLLRAHADQLRLVFTLRSDFEPQFTNNALFAQHVAEKTRFIVPPLSHAELREVIEGPATANTLFFEDSKLVDDLINEVVQTPGALPLLSFTLEQLYLRYLKRQEEGRAQGITIDRSLSRTDYQALGGVIGSLNRRATEEHDYLPDDAHRATLQRVMLRMVAVEGGELARRRVALEELKYSSDAENGRVQTVLDALVTARLVVRGQADADGDGTEDAFVEPAHDALVRAWDKLLVWKRAADEYLPLQRRLTQAASEWNRAEGKAKTGLLWNNNPRLGQLQQVLIGETTNGKTNGWISSVQQTLWPRTTGTNEPTWLNQLETEFVQTSVVWRANVLKRIVGITLGVIVALASIATFAEVQRRDARYQEGVAIHQRDVAQARALTAQAELTYEEEPLLALQLALAAHENLPDNEEKTSSDITDTIRRFVDNGRIRYFGNHVTNMERVSDTPWLILHYGSEMPSELRSMADGSLIDTLAGDVQLIQTVTGEFPFFLVGYKNTASELRNKGDGLLVQPLSGMQADSDSIELIDDDCPFFVINYRDAPGELRNKADGSLREQAAAGYIGVAPISDDFPFFVFTYSQGPSELRSKADCLSAVPLAGKVSTPLSSLERTASTDFDVFAVEYEDAPDELRSNVDGSLIGLAGVYDPLRFDLLSINSHLFLSGNELRSKADGSLIKQLNQGVTEVTRVNDKAPFLIVDYYGERSELRSATDGSLIEQLAGRYESDRRIPSAITVSEDASVFVMHYFDTPDEVRSTVDGSLIERLVAKVDDIQNVNKDSAIFVIKYRNAPDELRSKADGSLVERLTGGVDDPNEPGYQTGVITISEDSDIFMIQNLNVPGELRSIVDGSLIKPLAGKVNSLDLISADAAVFKVRYADAPSELRRKVDGALIEGLGVKDYLSIQPLNEGDAVFIVDYENGLVELRRKVDGSLVEQLSGVNSVASLSIADQSSAVFIVDYKNAPDELRSKADGSLITRLQHEFGQIPYSAAFAGVLVVRYENAPDELRSKADGSLVASDFIYDDVTLDGLPFYRARSQVTMNHLYSSVDNVLLGDVQGAMLEEDMQLLQFWFDENWDVEKWYFDEKWYVATRYDERKIPNNFSIVRPDQVTELWQLAPPKQLANLNLGVVRNLDSITSFGIGPSLFDHENATAAIRYADGRAYLLDLAWLAEIPSELPSLKDEGLVSIACIPLATRPFTQTLLANEESFNDQPLQACPGSVLLLIQGRVLAGKLDLVGAIAKFEEALALDPTLTIVPESEAKRIVAQSLVKQAQILLNIGKAEDAIVKLLDAFALDPSLEAAEEAERAGGQLLMQGHRLARAANFEDAIARFDQVLTFSKSLQLEALNAKAWLAMIQVLINAERSMMHQNNVYGTISKFEEVLAFAGAPGFSELRTEAQEIVAHVLVKSGRTSARHGDIEDAFSKFEEALTFDSSIEIETLRLEAQKTAARVLAMRARTMARAGDIKGATANFGQALALDPLLKISPEHEAKRLATQALVEHGRMLAHEGDVEGGIAKFEEALELDSSLKIVPEVEANRQYAPIVVEQAGELARSGEITASLAAISQAVQLDPHVKIDGNTWNAICWNGALNRLAAQVMAACENAVTTAPEDGGIRDSRGLARALVGDAKGALADFRSFVEANQGRNLDVRREVIRRLEAGEDPAHIFDAALLEQLKNE